MNLVSQYGYKQITLRQLAAVCGISKGPVDFYFKKKEDIIIIICQHFFTKAYSVMPECRDIPDDNLSRFPILSDLSDSNAYIRWFAGSTCEYLCPGLVKHGSSVEQEKVLKLCFLRYTVNPVYGIAIMSMVLSLITRNILRPSYNMVKNKNHQNTFLIDLKINIYNILRKTAKNKARIISCGLDQRDCIRWTIAGNFMGS